MRRLYVCLGPVRLVGPLLVGILLVAGPFFAPAVTAGSVPGYSPAFRVAGQVQNPMTYALADLQALPAHDVTVTFIGPGGSQTHQYRGALLLDVATAASPRFDPKQKNDKLRWAARVHATDNYEVSVAWGEFDPAFENKQVLVAYEGDGQLLSTEGMARLVVPGDLHGGRYVSNIDSIAFDPPHGAAGGQGAGFAGLDGQD